MLIHVLKELQKGHEAGHPFAESMMIFHQQALCYVFNNSTVSTNLPRTDIWILDVWLLPVLSFLLPLVGKGSCNGRGLVTRGERTPMDTLMLRVFQKLVGRLPIYKSYLFKTGFMFVLLPSIRVSMGPFLHTINGM
ncbi:UNVERIFIED_CONTAM: hypothetical protein K2H54_027254 [Gekko kuhli]